MRTSPSATRRSSAVVVYVTILVTFQVFLLTVAVEAYHVRDTGQAWATAAVSVTLAVVSAAVLRILRP